jgi:RNA polymerase sigma-70 factor (ECF subfamily)
VRPDGRHFVAPLVFLHNIPASADSEAGVDWRDETVATCVIGASAVNVLSTKNVLSTNVISGRFEKNRDDSERSLIQRAQRGEEQAFATLFELHKKRVYSVCLKMTRDVADAEDLTQEAFLQVFRNVNSFRGDSAFSTWLHRVAVNTVLMKLRRRQSAPLLSLDEPLSAESPTLKREVGKADPSLCGAVDRIALGRAIEELPEGCRQIFNLHEVQGYQHHEIAQLLQCSVGNSKSQLHKAKMKMRDMLFPKSKGLRKQIGKDGANDAPTASSRQSGYSPSYGTA